MPPDPPRVSFYHSLSGQRSKYDCGQPFRIQGWTVAEIRNPDESEAGGRFAFVFSAGQGGKKGRLMHRQREGGRHSPPAACSWPDAGRGWDRTGGRPSGGRAFGEGSILTEFADDESYPVALRFMMTDL